MTRSLLGLGLVCATFLSSADARAEDTSKRVNTTERAIKLDVLEANLRSIDEAQGSTWPVGVAALGVGGGLMTVGILTSDSDTLAPWVSGGAGALLAVGGAVSLLRSATHRELRAELARTRVQGGPDTLTRAEAVFDQAAERAWRNRVLVGSVITVLGVASLSLGTADLFRERQATLGMGAPGHDTSDERRESVAAGLISIGAIFTVAGVHTLLVRSDLERAQRAYHSAFSAPSPSNVSVRPALTPRPGGGLVGLSGTF